MKRRLLLIMLLTAFLIFTLAAAAACQTIQQPTLAVTVSEDVPTFDAGGNLSQVRPYLTVTYTNEYGAEEIAEDYAIMGELSEDPSSLIVVYKSLSAICFVPVKSFMQGAASLEVSVSSNMQPNATDGIDSVRQYIIVKYTDVNGFSRTVTDYSIMGELTAPQSMLYVSYKGIYQPFLIKVTAEKVVLELNGGTIADHCIAYNADGTISIFAVPIYSGKVFCGWYSDIALQNRWDFSTEVNNPITLYAKWTDEKAGTNGLEYRYVPQTVVDGKIIGAYYEVAGIGASIDKDIVIPEFYNKVQVKSVGKDAFSDCDITSVTLPSSIERIGAGAFSRCRNLQSFVMNRGVKTIEAGFLQSGIADCLYYGGTVADWCSINFAYEGVSDAFLWNVNAFYIGGILVDSVVIPEGVTKINDYAFARYNRLENVSFPKSLKEIGAHAFELTGLHNVIFADGLETVGSFAFSYCGDLITVKLSSTVKQIGDYAFWHSEKIMEVCNDSELEVAVGSETNGHVAYYAKRVYTSEEESGFVNIGNFRFYCAGTRNYLFEYFGDDADVILPEYFDGGSYDIYDSVFENNHTLETITVPDGVKSIGKAAFWGCSKLRQAVIPDSVEKIGANAFYGCSKLKTAKLPSKITEIPDSLFMFCFELQDVTIPEGVTRIGNSAFWNCNGIRNITVPNGVTTIEYHAFGACHNLVSVSLPDSITSIRKDSFEQSSKLQYTQINDCKYLGNEDNEYLVLMESSQSVSGTQWVINKTKVIAGFAFSGCSQITEMILPETVTAIGYRAFENCSKLTVLQFGGSSEQWNNMAKAEGWNQLSSLQKVSCHKGGVTITL